jgi:(p)ppGpp synthase/HD superfamily hydrolase
MAFLAHQEGQKLGTSRNTSPLSALLAALEFATRKHRDQRRKDASAIPTVNHPIALARRLVAGQPDRMRASPLAPPARA